MHTRDSKLNNIVSKVPQVTLGGAAIMTIAGILFFREAPSWHRIVGVAFAIIGCFYCTNRKRFCAHFVSNCKAT
jgi:drug/metabolite transporter (DMT)-like permease